MRTVADGGGGGGAGVDDDADGRDSWVACGDDEIAMQPMPDGLMAGLLLKLLVWFPYPIIEGLDQLPCID